MYFPDRQVGNNLGRGLGGQRVGDFSRDIDVELLENPNVNSIRVLVPGSLQSPGKVPLL